VYAFDPNPENIACVQRSAGANSDAKVLTVCKALGSHCGSVCGSVSSEISMVNLPLAVADDSSHFEVVTLDSLFESGQLPRADFLKTDVDGFEVELLRGAGRLLAACRPRILIEIHTHALAIGAHDLLAAHGYAFTDLTGHVISRDSLAKVPMAFDMWCEPSSNPAQAMT
jgi:FkbM family methyltransferase